MSRCCAHLVIGLSVLFPAVCGCGASANPNSPSSESGSAKGKADAAGNENGTDSDNASAPGQRPKDLGSDGKVEVCHRDSDQYHTLSVAASAVAAHLAHGDFIGPCGEPQVADTDLDGVPDDVDQCPDTPAGEDVYANGCTVIVVEADAGPSVSVLEGDAATLEGVGRVVQGDYDDADLVLSWEQVSGDPLDVEINGTSLVASTMDTEGEFRFRFTVSTGGGEASAFDEAVITVIPAHPVSVHAGGWHNVAILNNGDVQTWGWNQYGQLGDGSYFGRVRAADGGTISTLVADEDGVAWTFGNNVLVNSSEPVVVPSVFDVVQSAGLDRGGLLLDSLGTVWGFTTGENRFCEIAGQTQLGAVGVMGPRPIPGLPATITDVAAATNTGVALDADGVAWVWGRVFGCTPQPVLDHVVAVAAGGAGHFLFVRDDGTAWGLGLNLNGQLGNGTTQSSFNAPVQAVGVTDVVAVGAGDRHSLFLQADGSLFTAGFNRFCQLGLENEVQPASPVFGDTVATPTQVGIGDVVSVAAGLNHSVAVQADGSVRIWGDNGRSQLTLGTLTSLPLEVCTPMSVELP